MEYIDTLTLSMALDDRKKISWNKKNNILFCKVI
jgi:hypothetical protein